MDMRFFWEKSFPAAILRSEPRSKGERSKRVGLKGIAPLLAGVIYVAITLAAITVIVQVGNPLIKNIQDAIAIDNAKEMLANLDRTVREVAAEGKGSTRVVPIEFKRGKLVVDEASNQIFYELEKTKVGVVSPGARIEIGNLFITSGTDVNVTSNSTNYFVTNSHLNVTFQKLGSQASPVAINLSQIIQKVVFNLGEKEQATFNGSVDILIDNNATKSVGTGYTKAEKEGTGLAEGKIIAFVDNAYLSYNVEISIRSGDFLEIKASNFTSK